MTTENAIEMPSMRYFMVTWGVATEFGGMTTMCLARGRTLRELAGVDAPILTFGFQPGYKKISQHLHSAGHLVDGMKIMNIYDYYRSMDLSGREPVQAQSMNPQPTGLSDVQTQTVRDGSNRTYCQIIRTLDAKAEIRREYFRPDGARFLIKAAPEERDGIVPESIQLLDHNENCVATFKSTHDFYQAWMMELAGGQPSVFIADSLQTLEFVGNLNADHVLKFGVFHNSHIVDGGDPLRDKVASGRRALTEKSEKWDGLLFLTERHKEDFAARFGKANNLFCLSNPSPRSEAEPDFTRRELNRGVMVCRLDAVKNVLAAIEVINIVRESVPSVRLDIYGDGKQRSELQERIFELGLQDNVRLLGHVSNASAEFRTAAFSLLTSKKEGQPLALLESLGLGCPPVAFDVRYGPEDVIDDGSNGFLVPAGDVQAAAAAIVQLCTNPELAARLSVQAWEDSWQFGYEGVLERLGRIVDQAWNQRTERLEVTQMEFQLERTSLLRTGDVEFIGAFTWSQPSGEPAEDLLSVELQIVPRRNGAARTFGGEVLERAPGKLTVRLLTHLDDLSADAEVDDVLDAFVVVTGRNVLHRHRLEFSSGSATWIPYATGKGKLSFKAAPSA